MVCEFIECNVAEDFWCECIHCGRQLYGFMKAEDLTKLRINCQDKVLNSNKNDERSATQQGLNSSNDV